MSFRLKFTCICSFPAMYLHCSRYLVTKDFFSIASFTKLSFSTQKMQSKSGTSLLFKSALVRCSFSFLISNCVSRLVGGYVVSCLCKVVFSTNYETCSYRSLIIGGKSAKKSSSSSKSNLFKLCTAFVAGVILSSISS